MLGRATAPDDRGGTRNNSAWSAVVTLDLLILIAAAGLVLLGFLGLRRTLRRLVVHEHEWGLLYRNGKFRKLLEPGAYWRFCPPHELVRFDKRRILEFVVGQEVLTGDNIGLKISLVAEYRIADPVKLVGEVAHHQVHLHNEVQLAAREAVAKRALEVLLGNRDEIAQEVQGRVVERLSSIGLDVLGVTLRDFMLSKEIRTSHAAVLTARKEGEAALERARGEQAALRNLSNAARMLKDNPDLLQLRVLQAVSAPDGARTFVFGLPAGAPVIPQPPGGDGKIGS